MPGTIHKKHPAKLSEKFARKLYEASRSDKSNRKIKEARVILGYWGDDEARDDESEVSYLKDKHAIISYRLEKFEPEDFTFPKKAIDDLDETENLEGYSGEALLSAICKFYPDKIENFLEENSEKRKDGKEEIKEILIVTPTIGNFEYVWIVLNNDYEHKLRASVKGKAGYNTESYAMKLCRLADKKKIEYDKCFWDDVNYSLCKRSSFKDRFLKTTILKRFRGEIEINNGITIKKVCKALMEKPEIDYF